MRISVMIPVYNEEQFIEKCLTSVMRQTLKPKQIIIVDDGSTDKTLPIVRKFRNLQIVKLQDHKKEPMVERVPLVLAAGSKLLEDSDYIAILDGDTVLETRYYENLTAKMQTEKKVGIACGKLNGPGASGGLMLGLIPYVYGCNRLYKESCWLKLNDGKIMKYVPVWDFYHNVYAEMLGYTVKQYNGIQSWALRPPGFKKAFFNGYVCYQVGYHGYFLLLRAAKNRKPGLVAGYLKAKFSGAQEYPVKSYVRYLQTLRMRRLIGRVLP